MTICKILQICDRAHDYVQGFDLTEEIARGLVGAGHDVTFGILSGEPDEGLSKRVGCAVKSFGFSKRKLKPTSLSLMLELIRYIRINEFDIVITHRFKPWLMLAFAAYFLPRCRFAAVFHAFKQFDRQRRQWLAKALLTRRWRLVAVSQALRNDLIAHGIPAAQTRVIINSIDIDGMRAAQLSREDARAELHVPEQATVIGTIGRCKAVKGQRYLIDAFAQIAERWPQTLLLIIGGGEEESALHQQVIRYGLQQRVIITGNRINASRLLPAFDVFVLPSLSEGLGLAMLEAMATPLPAIGTRAGGLPEAIGEHGILVNPANSEQLADAIEHVLQWSPEQRASYISALQQHLRAHFSIQQYHQRCRDLVDELMAINVG